MGYGIQFISLTFVTKSLGTKATILFPGHLSLRYNRDHTGKIRSGDEYVSLQVLFSMLISSSGYLTQMRSRAKALTQGQKTSKEKPSDKADSA